MRKRSEWSEWRKSLRERLARPAGLIGRHAGRLAYYGGIAVALCAIALAAGEYRRGEDGDGEALLLPAADLSGVMERIQAEPEASLPEGWRLVRGFSRLPEWNGELGQWEAHTGVDVAFADGMVPCLREGEVVGLGRSGIWGSFVELKCGGRIFRYAGVEAEEGLEIGSMLAAGERIGRMDGSMPGEAGMEAHVHLEVWEGEEAIDFEQVYAKIPAGD